MSKLKFTTPKGELKWAFISGQGKTDLQGRQIYTADIVVPMEYAQPTLDQINELWEEHKPKGAKAAKSLGYKVDDSGNFVTFTFKTATAYPSGDPKEILIYNAKAQRVSFDDKIGNGSTGRISGMASIYDAGVAARGVTLYLDAIQLIKLVKYETAGGDFAAEAEADAFDGTGADGFIAEDL